MLCVRITFMAWFPLVRQLAAAGSSYVPTGRTSTLAIVMHHFSLFIMLPGTHMRKNGSTSIAAARCLQHRAFTWRFGCKTAVRVANYAGVRMELLPKM